MRHLLLSQTVNVDRQRCRPARLNLRHLMWAGLMLGFGWMPNASSVSAAERVYVSYGVLERSIPVASLETYAREGTIDDDLAVYAAYAGPDELRQLRSVLLARADLSPVAVSQFLYSPQGELLLDRLGRIIQSESRSSGFRALRAALILASADSDGLSLLNVLRKFPTRGLRIDVAQSLAIVSSLERAVNQTNRVTETVIQESTAEIASELAIEVNQLADLRVRGLFTWQKRTLPLIDASRQATGSFPLLGLPNPAIELGIDGRVIPVDLYLPLRGQPQLPKTLPVVVISHGLGSDRDTFTYLAQHLASYGFAVLVPEHPGSNAGQIQALLNGVAREVAEPREFVDRPLDITFLLNQMEQQAAVDPALKGRLNLKRVGVIGQSFGGYTALILAGAPINFQQLNRECNGLSTTLNLSLLLQCQARALGQVNSPLKDDRVQAVMAINPVTSAILGQDSIRQIQVPTMIVAGSADTVAPALTEQFQPFTWLTVQDKYLLLMDRGTHFSTLGDPDSSSAIPLPDEVIGPSQATARRYTTAMATAFMQTYIANQPAYRSYLRAAYARSISEAPIPLSLVRNLTAEQIATTKRQQSSIAASH